MMCYRQGRCVHRDGKGIARHGGLGSSARSSAVAVAGGQPAAAGEVWRMRHNRNAVLLALLMPYWVCPCPCLGSCVWSYRRQWSMRCQEMPWAGRCIVVGGGGVPQRMRRRPALLACMDVGWRCGRLRDVSPQRDTSTNKRPVSSGADGDCSNCQAVMTWLTEGTHIMLAKQK